MRGVVIVLWWYFKAACIAAIVVLCLAMYSRYAFADDHPDYISADIWVTKYALTRGIQHEKAKLQAGGRVAFTSTNYYKNSEFEFTEQQAVDRAELMRRKEIASLQNKLERLNKLKFEVAK